MKKILPKTVIVTAAALAAAVVQAVPAGAAWVPNYPCGGHRNCAAAVTTSNLPAAPVYTCPYGENCPYGGVCYGLGQHQGHRTGHHGRNYCRR